MADKNFLTDIIDADLAEGKVKEIHTRFPPEKPCVVKQYFQKKTNYFVRVVLFRLARAGVCQSKCPEGGARLPQAVGRGMECPSLAWQSSPSALLQNKTPGAPKRVPGVMAGVVSFELTARGFGDRCSTS